MIEKEVKVLDIDKNKTIKALKKLGAKKTFEGEVYSVFYDFKNGFVRLRRFKEYNLSKYSKKNMKKIREKCILTLKATIKKDKKFRKFKLMKEYEISVNNFETARKILNLCGLKERKNSDKYNKKYRITFKIKDTLFEFDKYKSIPWFLEIEGSENSINKYIKVLKLNPDKIKPFGFKEVKKYYNKID